MSIGELDSVLSGPNVDANLNRALDALVDLASKGHKQNAEFFNPSEEWIVSKMRILQDLSEEDQSKWLDEARKVEEESERLDAEGRAAARAWPEVVVRLDNGGLSFFSQLGVARRPDLTQYFVDGFTRNRDSLAVSVELQSLLSEIVPYITRYMEERFSEGDTIVQTDRQLGDAEGRTFHARQLLFGTTYMQLPYMWRQLTFELPEAQISEPPDILEVSVPRWLEDLGLSDELKKRVSDAAIPQLVFKAPTKGLSLHLGFDYMGEHKMGPLSIAMFKVKENAGLAIQAALSVCRVRTQGGHWSNSALVTAGPSLHGKSTLTIMLELAGSRLSHLLGLSEDPDEGVYPMNDDIVLIQPLSEPIEVKRGSEPFSVGYGIDGTENNFYAVPFGLNREDDPITFDVVRGTDGSSGSREILENVLVNPSTGEPDYMQNPVRNMRMVLPRERLLERKGISNLLNSITGGSIQHSVHVPMEHMDKILWQGVMRQNTVAPPLIRLNCEQFVRSLMFGEAVQTGAVAGAVGGRPYVEYFSDPFIIGLEDENANSLYRILKELEQGGLPQEYYIFNTGGVGAESNNETSGDRYKKITRELTLMLQESILREAVKFEFDRELGADVAVAIVDDSGNELIDFREEWIPSYIYDNAEYSRRISESKYKRYYGESPEDKSGILRYTKVISSVFDWDDVPAPRDVRELTVLASFIWEVDQGYSDLQTLVSHLGEGKTPDPEDLSTLEEKFQQGIAGHLILSEDDRKWLPGIGLPLQ